MTSSSLSSTFVSLGCVEHRWSTNVVVTVKVSPSKEDDVPPPAKAMSTTKKKKKVVECLVQWHRCRSSRSMSDARLANEALLLDIHSCSHQREIDRRMNVAGEEVRSSLRSIDGRGSSWSTSSQGHETRPH